MANMRSLGDFFDKIRVVDCELTKTRIGGPHDGGYVALNEICKKTDKVLTFGVGDDVSFELDFVKRYPATQKFTLCDPTIMELPETHDKFEHVRKYAHQVGFDGYSGYSLLKMDIEWWEWEFLRKINADDLKKFSQILIELHVFHLEQKQNGMSNYFHMLYREVFEHENAKLFARYSEMIDKILKNFYIVHIHANNSLPKVYLDAWSFPPLIELSLIRKDLAGEVIKTREKFPTTIDRVNKTDRPDVINYYPITAWGESELRKKSAA